MKSHKDCIFPDEAKNGRRRIGSFLRSKKLKAVKPHRPRSSDLTKLVESVLNEEAPLYGAPLAL